MTVLRVAGRIGGLRGWPRAAVATAAGAIAALALPPYGLLPALVVAMTVAVWLLDGTLAEATVASSSDAAPGSLEPSAKARRSSGGLRVRRAAVVGWCFGFGYFVAGLWWLGAAFLVDNDEFAWALPLGVLGLPAGLAFFSAAGFGLAGLLWSRSALRILILAGALAGADYVRGHVLSGFPWNAFGMTLADHLSLAQAGAIVGLYGLSLAAVAIAAVPATLADNRTLPARIVPTALGVVLLAALAGYGAWRVPDGPVADVAGVRFRIMQPNLEQDSQKFTYDNREEIMRHYLTLTDGPDRELSSGHTDVTHVIWPESAFPFILSRNEEARAQIAALLPPGVVLVTGGARTNPRLPGELATRFYNSLQVVNDQGQIVSWYDKVHLVPFGEYLPFGDLLQRLGLRQFVHVPGGFTAGIGHDLLPVPGLPAVTPLICYEAIFPGNAAPAQGARPALILNVTNDAWFGNTPGPYQHFAQAKLRALEEGIPLVRAANTGISAVVDPYGRVTRSLPLGKEGILDAALPSRIAPTPYSQRGDLGFAVLMACCFLARTVSDRRRSYAVR